MRRFVRVLLALNIAIVLVNKVVELRSVSSQATAGSLLRTAVIDLVVLTVGFILLLLLVLARFESDPTWLFAPAMFLVPLSIASIYLAVTSAAPPVPAVLRALLAACYLAAYYRLRGGQTRREGVLTGEAARA